MYKNSSRRDGKVVHPGEILFAEVMRPHDISQNALARCIGFSPRRINEIVRGKRAITAETAVALEEALGISAHFWMSLQADHDIEKARRRRMDGVPKPRRPLPVLGFDEPFRRGRRNEGDLERGYDDARHDLAVF